MEAEADSRLKADAEADVVDADSEEVAGEAEVDTEVEVVGELEVEVEEARDSDEDDDEHRMGQRSSTASGVRSRELLPVFFCVRAAASDGRAAGAVDAAQPSVGSSLRLAFGSCNRHDKAAAGPPLPGLSFGALVRRRRRQVKSVNLRSGRRPVQIPGTCPQGRPAVRGPLGAGTTYRGRPRRHGKQTQTDLARCSRMPPVIAMISAISTQLGPPRVAERQSYPYVD